MKTSITTPLFILLGGTLAFILPLTNGVYQVLVVSSEIVTRIAPIFLFPLVFFSFAVAVDLLRRKGLLRSSLLSASTLVLVGTPLLILLGVTTAQIVPLSRIPVSSQTATPENPFDWPAIFRALVPETSFQLLGNGVGLLLPLVIMSALIGLQFSFDREVSQPAFDLFDSLDRLFYRLNKFLVMGFGLLLAPLATQMIFWLRLQENVSSYGVFLISLLGLNLAILFLVIPLILSKFGKISHPYRTLWRISPALWAALISGNLFLSLSSLIPHLKENLELKRPIGAFCTPLLIFFARMGTATVTAIAFLVVLKSYSVLHLSLLQLILVWFFSWIASFCLALTPVGGVSAALRVVAFLYGKSLEKDVLILGPVLPLLTGMGALLDVALVATVVLSLSKRNGAMTEEIVSSKECL